MKTYSIYIYTNKISGKFYIGQSCNPKMRHYSHKSEALRGSNTIFHKAIRKYRFDNFEFDILESNLSKIEADNLEIRLIALYNTRDKKCGYNQLKGGNYSGELFGKLNGQYGKKRPDLFERNKQRKGRTNSEESKEKQRQKMLGRVVSEETKQLMKVSGQKRWNNVTNENKEKHKLRISKLHKGKIVPIKQIICNETFQI
jgi:group I intron endonuclease